jgi:hypothetical protein
VVFDRRGSAEVRDVNTIMPHLAFPKPTVGYCAARYTGVKAIMAAVPRNEATLHTTVEGCAGRYASSCWFHRFTDSCYLWGGP